MNKIKNGDIKIKLKEIFSDKDKTLNFFIDLFLFLFLCTKTGMGKSMAVEAICLAGFIILIGCRIIKNKEKIILSKYNLWYVLFTIFACLSYFWAMSKEYALKLFPSIIALSALTIALMNYIKKKEDFNKLLNMFIVANIYAALKILILYFFTDGTPARRILEITGIHFNTVAQVLGFSVIITIYLLMTTKNKKYILAILIQMLVIYIAESRKALLIPIFATIVIILLKKKTRKEIKNYIIIGLVGVLALILLIQINPETKKEFNNLIFSFIFQEETDDSSINLRNFFIDTGIELFNQKPITGAGLNNFAYYVKNYTEYTEDRYSHNNYVEMLSCLGVVGLALFYWIYVYIIIRIITKKERNITNIFAVALILTLAIFEWGIVSYSGCMYNIVIFISYYIAESRDEKELLKEEK